MFHLFLTKFKNKIFTPAKRFELSYYRNQLIHLFVNDGVIAVALYGNIRFRDEPVNRKKLTEDIAFISVFRISYHLHPNPFFFFILKKTLLKIEVIFQTEQNLTVTIEATLKQMQEDGIIAQEGDNVRLLKSGHPAYDFLCALLWPFIDCNFIKRLLDFDINWIFQLIGCFVLVFILYSQINS